MGSIHINNINDYDELDEIYGGTEKFKNGKTKNNNDEDLYQSQRLPDGWREGDSFISRQKKSRSSGRSV